MNQLKIGVIGAGAISALHLDVIRAIDHIEVLSITSRTWEKAYKLSKVYNIPHVYRTIEDFLSGVGVDAIMVLVSADQMASVLQAVIPCGLPLFVEKPPALSLREAKALVDFSNEHNTLVMVGLNRRHFSIFAKGVEIIKKYGKLLAVSIEGHERFWKLNQSSFSEAITDAWLYANSLHTIDLLRFFGGEIADYHALSTSLQQPNGDQFVASLRFSSGCLGQYISCWYSPGGWSVKLYGEGVTVSFKPLEEGCWEDISGHKGVIEPEKFDIDFKPGFYQQMLAFRDMVHLKKYHASSVSLESAYKSMELVGGMMNNMDQIEAKTCLVGEGCE